MPHFLNQWVKVMHCNLCGSETIEQGACRTCLPYNIYASEDVLRLVPFDRLRMVVLDAMPHLEKQGFLTAKDMRRADPDTKMETYGVSVGDQRIMLVPIIDTAGEESICFTLSDTHSSSVSQS